jgi:hypothetical protein
MAQRTYRTNRPTLAIANRDGKNVVVTVPAGAPYIKAHDFPPRNRLVEVEWNGQIVKMFAMDIGDRGELVAAAS